jgi:Bacterial TniB protein
MNTTPAPTTASDEPLTTKEGWRNWVETEPHPPNSIAETAWQQLDPTTRDLHTDARLAYHSDLVIVNTPTIREVITTGRRLVLLNRSQISARRGLIVTGAPATGKTTAITQLGRAHELLIRRRYPNDNARLPVLYVTVPPAATPRMVAVEFARFLGLPLTTRSNHADVTNAVCGVLADVHCDLVLIDEIHNLNLATRSGAEASDQLKYFSERIRATFMYAGIDVEHVGLFSGTRGRQIAGRFATIPSSAFAYGSTAHRETWQAVVATLEQALRLHRHTPGSLLALERYLYQRTAGMIGSLSHLIRAAAIDAINDGTEKITKNNLDGIRLDHAAQTTSAATRAPRQSSSSPRRQKSAQAGSTVA